MALPIATKAIFLITARRRFNALVVACLLLACNAAAAEQCGLLWRVEPANAPASHVFGTIHSEDPRVMDLPAPVSRAFQHADIYAMELIPDFQLMADLARAMHFQDQRNLKQVLENDVYRRAVDALSERGVGEGLAMKMKPWAVAVTLSFPQPETGVFLDMMLFNRAMSAGKRTVGLEEPEEQLAFFTGLSMAEQTTLLEATLGQTGEIEKTMDRLVRAWLSRDPGQLSAMSDEYLSDLPGELARRFREQAIDRRNHRMFEAMKPLLAEGNVFVAVGALHLYGDEGLLELLRGHGYEVSCVH